MVVVGGTTASLRYKKIRTGRSARMLDRKKSGFRSGDDARTHLVMLLAEVWSVLHVFGCVRLTRFCGNRLLRET